MNAITIGLDIAESGFQVHAEDASGKVVLQKRLPRSRIAAFLSGVEYRAKRPEPAGRSPVAA